MKNKKTPVFLVIIGSLSLAVTLIVYFIVVAKHNPANRDFMSIWLAGKMFLMGKQPYVSSEWLYWRQYFGSTWLPGPFLIYPLPMTLFAAPIALFPINIAYAIWLGLTTYIIGLTIWHTEKLSHRAKSKALFLPLLLSVLIARPTFLTYFHGQFTVILLFVFLYTWLLWRAEHWFWGGVLLSLAFLKPNITFIIIAFIAVWLLLRRHWPAIGGIISGSLALFVIGALQDPGWVGKAVQIGTDKISYVFGRNPTIWGIAHKLCKLDQNCTLQIGSILSLLIILLVFYLLWRLRETLAIEWVIGLSTAASLLVFPYLWNYEQTLLLLPLSALVFRLFDRGVKYMPLALGILGFTFSTWIYLMLAVYWDHDFISSMGTIQSMALFIWIALKEHNDVKKSQVEAA